MKTAEKMVVSELKYHRLISVFPTDSGYCPRSMNVFRPAVVQLVVNGFVSRSGGYMMKVLLVSVLVFVLPLVAIAQENSPKAEVFGGYSYFRANNPLSFVNLNLNGWNASVSGNVSKWFGIVGDFSGHYGSPQVLGFSVPFLKVNTYSLLFGPGLYYRSDKITPFAHFLIGTTRASAGVFGLSYSKNALSAAVGGGIDLKLNNSFAVRVFQADYLMTRFYDERQNNLRLSAGIVFLFGNH